MCVPQVCRPTFHGVREMKVVVDDLAVGASFRLQDHFSGAWLFLAAAVGRDSPAQRSRPSPFLGVHPQAFFCNPSARHCRNTRLHVLHHVDIFRFTRRPMEFGEARLQFSL